MKSQPFEFFFMVSFIWVIGIVYLRQLYFFALRDPRFIFVRLGFFHREFELENDTLCYRARSLTRQVLQLINVVFGVPAYALLHVRVAGLVMERMTMTKPEFQGDRQCSK